MFIVSSLDSSMGQWALPHVNAVGKSVESLGPAQRPLGWGYIDYRDHFRGIGGRRGHI